MSLISLKRYKTAKTRDFSNGALRDEIYDTIKNREHYRNLCRELDIELDGVQIPATAAAIMNAIRTLLSDEDAQD